MWLAREEGWGRGQKKHPGTQGEEPYYLTVEDTTVKYQPVLVFPYATVSPLHCCLQRNGFQGEAILSSMHLAMPSGDIWGCRDWVGERYWYLVSHDPKMQLNILHGTGLPHNKELFSPKCH